MARVRKKSASVTSRKKRVTADERELARSRLLARRLAQIAPEEDPAHVAGAIAIFATETIRRSANNLMEARAYLEGLRGAIDGLLKNAFPEPAQPERRTPRRPS